MSATETSHCRFCAEIKAIGKLINLESDKTRRGEIVKKLSHLNPNNTNLFERDNLPNTVCLICLESLDRAYEFVKNVEHAQRLLSIAYKKVKKEEIASDDDNTEPTPNKPVKDEPVEANVVKVPKKVVRSPSCPSQTKSQPTWKDYNWTCAKCGTEFPTIDEFKSHSMTYHDCCNAFKCTDCNKKMLRLDKFVLHVKRHRNYLKLSCYVCNSKFSSTHKASVHKTVHTLSEHICSGCNSAFASMEDLTQHVKLYYKNRSGSSLAVMDTSDNLTCVLCKKTFKNKGALNGHLLVHVKRNPNKERDHICDRCGKGYYNKADLAAHVASHEEARPYQCEICKSDFKTPVRLKAHIKVHNDIKPYPCGQCGRQFRLKKQLRSHEIIHTDSLPFACLYCSKAFRFKTIRDLHLRQHTGDKPYSCEVCQRNFTNWSNYNKHMKRRHGMSMVKRKLNLSMTKNMPVTGDTYPPELEKVGIDFV